MPVVPQSFLNGILSAVCVAALSAVCVPTATADSGPGVCEGVRGCEVVARVDVNGDGRKDGVGLARRGNEDAETASVVVRVKVGSHRIVKKRRPIPGWYGPDWQGSAHVDGKRGRELFVGADAGAHTQWFHVLTWRKGRLTTLKAPTGGKTWMIDGAYWISQGWQHRKGDPAGKIRFREAVRIDNSKHFAGRVRMYRWSDDGWERKSVKKHPRLPEERAYRWGGFHIPGLPRY